MELSGDDLNSKLDILPESVFGNRPSSQSRSRTRNRLHKERPVPKMRGSSHGPTFSMPGDSFNAWRNSGSAASGFGVDGEKTTRRGSLRDAVRRIFGRKRRTIALIPEESTSRLSNIPRHTYHQSEPISGLAMHAQVQEANHTRPEPERMLSVRNPDRSPTPGTQRAGSPFAVSFPKSAMLKPMDLGNTFLPVASPGLKRRKTLPSVHAEDEQGNNGKDPIDHAADEAAREETLSPDFEGVGQGAVKFSKKPASPRKRIKRRSKSIDDVIRVRRHSKKRLSTGNRDRDIHVWRQSFQQPDVMRTSGFYNRNAVQQDAVAQAEGEMPNATVHDQDEPGEHSDYNDRMPMPHTAEHIPCTEIPAGGQIPQMPMRSASLRSAGSQYATADELNQHSSPDHDPPIDLETRIANIEAGLTSFQASINRLTSSHHRRTIVVGQANPRPRRSSTSDRTANTLDPFNQEHEYIRSLQSSMSPGSKAAAAKSIYDLPSTHPESLFNPPNNPLPQPQSSPPHLKFPTPPHSSHRHSPSPQTSPTPQSPPFPSLYHMLSIERSARRTLEAELRTLQAQVNVLTARLSAPSNFPDDRLNPDPDGQGDPRRSSYLLMGTSARLHALLDETDSFPSSSPSPSLSRTSSLRRDTRGVWEATRMPTRMPVTSRFSGSESELGRWSGLHSGDGDGVREIDFGGGVESSSEETPVEAYCTPGEERTGYNFDYGAWEGRRGAGEVEMF